MRTNDFKLSPHFKLYEFADQKADDLVVVHPALVSQLEELRERIQQATGQEHEIIITSGTRTEVTNNALGEKLGWTDAGGSVSHDSQHLPKHSGAAADIYARHKRTKDRMPIAQLSGLCRGLFDTVIARYNSHVHVDVRNRIQPDPDDVTKPEPHK